MQATNLLLSEDRIDNQYFLLNFTNFLRAALLQNTCGQMVLKNYEVYLEILHKLRFVKILKFPDYIPFTLQP